MMAILKKQYAVVELLLQAKPDLSTRDYLGNTALTYALQGTRDDIAARLVELSCTDAASEEDATECPKDWQLGAFTGLVPLTFKAEGNPADYAVTSAIQGHNVLTCCACGFPLTAIALLQNGYPDGKDGLGRTALHYAYNLDEDRFGDQRTLLISSLIAHGADENQVDDLGYLPLQGVQQPPVEQAQHACKGPVKMVLKKMWKWVS